MNVKPILRELQLRPSKARGQSFLADERFLEVIIKAADLSPDDTVLEVGPGLGILTFALAQHAGRVIAVEIEPRLVAYLRERAAGLPHVEIIEGDILHLVPDVLPSSPYKVVANIPYAITSALLRCLLEAPRPPTRLVIMVQKEVAQRILARPGEMSLLTVAVQYYGEPYLVTTVPAGAFYPVPKVDSAILRIDVLPKPRLPGDRQAFFKIVTAGFSQRRKQLKNALSHGLNLPVQEVVSGLRAANIDERRRAETLTLEEWGRLAAWLAERQGWPCRL